MNIPQFFAICTLSTTKEESIAEALCRGMLASFFYFFEKLTNKAFKIVSREALKNAMYCHLKSYSSTSSGTKILPEVS